MSDLAGRLVSMAGELFGYRGKVMRKASPDADYLVDNSERRCPDIAKAREHLAYNLSIGLEEDLRHNLIWFRENRDGTEA